MSIESTKLESLELFLDLGSVADVRAHNASAMQGTWSCSGNPDDGLLPSQQQADSEDDGS